MRYLDIYECQSINILYLLKRKEKIKKKGLHNHISFPLLFCDAKSFALLGIYALHKEINNESIFEKFYCP
jgi:hypothetical protein